MDDLKEDQVAVIFKINFIGEKGLFFLSQEYSAYPDEGEILVQDGLQYLVKTNEQKQADEADGIEYRLIELEYNPGRSR